MELIKRHLLFINIFRTYICINITINQGFILLYNKLKFSGIASILIRLKVVISKKQFHL